MRVPWFEAGPALAAAGFSLRPDPDNPEARLGNIWTRPMIDSARYAFLPRLDAVTKPTVFADLHHLARHIERKRLAESGDRGLQLEDVEDLQFAGEPGLHRGVQIWLLDMANDREASLGYAWLRGDGREVLERVLLVARRDLAGQSAITCWARLSTTAQPAGITGGPPDG
jgi:hypothetical protein